MHPIVIQVKFSKNRKNRKVYRDIRNQHTCSDTLKALCTARKWQMLASAYLYHLQMLPMKEKDTNK